MNIIYIYWPPAVWKLTTAKELSKITWYKILHNHLTLDLVNYFFDRFKSEELFYSMNEKINLFLLQELFENINWVIMTQCYEEKYDKNYIKKLIDLVKIKNINIYFVKLECNIDELLKRVESEDRKNSKKLSNKIELNKLLKNWDLNSNIEWYDTLTIKNDNKTANEVAKQITKYYNL